MNEVSFFSHVDQDVKSKSIPVCNYFCDTKYLLPYSTFVNLRTRYCSLSTYCHDAENCSLEVMTQLSLFQMMFCLDSEVDSKMSNGVCAKSEVSILDLYLGCEAMSTGLCLGARLGSVNLVTIWAVDYIGCACKSLEQK
ncbi:hypothetical protein ACFX1S_005612 [Malus domestica]